MSDSENFLNRWSKRKLAERERSTPEPAADRDPVSSEANSTAAPLKTDDSDTTNEQPLDPASLPPVDSIGANSDVAAFLRPGVPAELTRAALRRAWTSDPAIRDFVGLVENGWDFNDPAAMTGFGAISAEEAAQLASRLVGDLGQNLGQHLPQSVTGPVVGEGEQAPKPLPSPPHQAAAGDSPAAGHDDATEENDAPQQKSAT